MRSAASTAALLVGALLVYVVCSAAALLGLLGWMWRLVLPSATAPE